MRFFNICYKAFKTKRMRKTENNHRLRGKMGQMVNSFDFKRVLYIARQKYFSILLFVFQLHDQSDLSPAALMVLTIRSSAL